MGKITTVILAAGKSTRFKGSKSKLVQELAGLQIICHLVNAAKKISGNDVIIVCIIIFAWYYTSYDQVIGVAPESDEYKGVYYIYIYPKQNLNNHTSWCEDILLNGPNKIGLLIPKDSSISDIELYYKQFIQV